MSHLAESIAVGLEWSCTTVKKPQALRNKHWKHLIAHVPVKEHGCAGELSLCGLCSLLD